MSKEKNNENKSGKRLPKALRVILTVLGVIAAIYGIIFVINVFVNISLRNYIKTFEPVQYSEDRVVPVMEDGYYTITTDEDLRIMHFTDVHIGGGFWTYKDDKKTLYELITMLQAEKPDIVVLGGDNTYCVPGFGFNGGFTFNNKMVAKTLITALDHEGVYFTTVLGNHDTESFDYADRQEIGDLYMSGYSDYCFFDEDFTDPDADTVPSVSNQIVVVKNTSGQITKLLLLIDSNAYIDTSFISSAKGLYDVIHDEQIEWAQNAIADLSAKAGLPEGEYLKSICFMHIPVGEYRTALDELITEVKDEDGEPIAYEQNEDTGDTEFISGEWGEKYVCFGGYKDPSAVPNDMEQFFETLCEDMNSVEAIVCGHDHTNNAVVKYKGIYLIYGYSVDNEAYGTGISKVGRQRGATVITLSPDGSFTQQHKNAYTDYGCDPDKFFHVDVEGKLYPQYYRTVN